MTTELLASSVLVGFVSAAVAAVFTHYLLEWLGRQKARRAHIGQRIDALEERACAWLQILPSNVQGVNQESVQKRLFEIALSRLERMLSVEQNKTLRSNCLNLPNVSETRQAKRELDQILQNAGTLYKSVDRS